mgnify:CR=1 FL=1
MYRGFARAPWSHAVVVLFLALGIVTVATAGPAMAQGSASGMRAQYLSDFETMQTKFKELAGAMDADSYGWRPMDGVRTVSEVFMLIVAENYVVPSAWSATPPNGITPGFVRDQPKVGRIVRNWQASQYHAHQDTSERITSGINLRAHCF